MLSIADVIVIFNILKDKKRYVCTDIFFKASFNIIKKSKEREMKERYQCLNIKEICIFLPRDLTRERRKKMFIIVILNEMSIQSFIIMM